MWWCRRLGCGQSMAGLGCGGGEGWNVGSRWRFWDVVVGRVGMRAVDGGSGMWWGGLGCGQSMAGLGCGGGEGWDAGSRWRVWDVVV